MVGIDINPKVFDKNMKYDELILADASSLPFESERFDYTVCADVIDLPELRERRANCMKEIERVTRNGIFYHFYNGKSGPMRDLVRRYGEVTYIGLKNDGGTLKIKDSYKTRYRRLKVRNERVLRLLDRSSSEERRFLKSMKKDFFCLGSYIVYVERLKYRS